VRVNPVSSAGRANVRRKRPSPGEGDGERRAQDFASHLPVPLQPALEREQAAYSTRYRPNSVFLAHLLATRDSDLQTRNIGQSEALTGVNSYRATAALPRRRAAGHLLKTER
jgi:hypothetical protein